MKNITATETIAKMTPKGREFMRAVGNGEFSFFDQGICEGSGSWGGILSEEGFASVRSASGVMGATAKLGLWEVMGGDEDLDAGKWWSLTALGADVALTLAEQANAEAVTADTLEVKRGPKWTYIFVNGEQVMEVRSHLADQVLATVKFI